jgi:predicted DNA-binding protein with PD1-like motif
MRFLLYLSFINLSAQTVPAVSTAASPIERVVVVRLKNGTDMLDGLRKAVAREKIRNGVILSGFGSVTSYHVHVVGNTTLPPKDVFTKEGGPFDLLGVSGLVMDGRVHAHITLANTSKVTGGHLEAGTSVFTFTAISIGVLKDDVDLSRVDDWKWH